MAAVGIVSGASGLLTRSGWSSPASCDYLPIGILCFEHFPGLVSWSRRGIKSLSPHFPFIFFAQSELSASPASWRAAANQTQSVNNAPRPTEPAMSSDAMEVDPTDESPVGGPQDGDAHVFRHLCFAWLA